MCDRLEIPEMIDRSVSSGCWLVDGSVWLVGGTWWLVGGAW